MPELRESLLEEEMERREKYLSPVDKTEFPRDVVVERVQLYVIETLLKKELPPFVSASYFNWRIDQRLWTCFGDGEKDAEFPPAPPICASPYSTPYVKAYFAANPIEGEAKENKEVGKGKGKEKEEKAGGNRCLGFTRASTQVVDHADGDCGELVGFPLLPPMEDKVRLHQDLLGKAMPYQEGCGPFEVECPFSALGKDFEACFGPMEGLVDLLKEASLFMGGTHGVLLYAKFRDLPDGDRRVSLLLEWHDMVKIESPAWQRVLYKAWCALLSLFHSQLQGVRMGLMDHLREYYGASMSEHMTLYSRIGAAVHHLDLQERDRREAMEEDDKREAEALLAKMERFAKEHGTAFVAQRVEKKPSLAEKIKELARLRDNPRVLTRFGDDPKVRQMIIEPTAKKVLAEQILSSAAGSATRHLDPSLCHGIKRRRRNSMK
ncbi:hypothetical protein CHU98_g8876 [Xylaria longipes]|nr:hypothetical protein CHU98_g8876 [Xylaria longipes]